MSGWHALFVHADSILSDGAPTQGDIQGLPQLAEIAQAGNKMFQEVLQAHGLPDTEEEHLAMARALRNIMVVCET